MSQKHWIDIVRENYAASLIPAPKREPITPPASTAILADFTNLRIIGRCTCGTIYTSPSLPTVAYKIGRDRDALWNDIKLTARAHRSLAALDPWRIGERRPRVPALKEWLTNEGKESWWVTPARFFAELKDTETIPIIFAFSLIPTIDLDARQTLISRHESTTPKAAVRANPENDFCLVRPYLRLASRKGEPLCRPENLWNFPLTREDLRSPFDDDMAMTLAKEMAIGLAVIHWHADVDGMDIEFVLGGDNDWKQSPDKHANNLDTST
jgi:hypothetical protein